MIAMTETEYKNIADQSLEKLKQETPQGKIELKQKRIQTR